jgi:hypothetical protein
MREGCELHGSYSVRSCWGDAAAPADPTVTAARFASLGGGGDCRAPGQAAGNWELVTLTGLGGFWGWQWVEDDSVLLICQTVFPPNRMGRGLQRKLQKTMSESGNA